MSSTEMSSTEMISNTVFNYTIIKDKKYKYKYTTFMHVSIRKENEYFLAELKKYMKSANYKFIQFIIKDNKIIVTFTVTLEDKYDNPDNIDNNIMDIINDFNYVLTQLKNEKKIMKHYTSFTRVCN